MPICAETFLVDADNPGRRLRIIGARRETLKRIEDEVAQIVERPRLNHAPGKNESRSGDKREKIGATPLHLLTPYDGHAAAAAFGEEGDGAELMPGSIERNGPAFVTAASVATTSVTPLAALGAAVLAAAFAAFVAAAMTAL